MTSFTWGEVILWVMALAALIIVLYSYAPNDVE